MKMMKLMVMCAVLFTAFFVQAATRYALYSVTVDGIKWICAVYDGKASPYGGSSSNSAVPQSTSGSITIPSTLVGYPVTSIGSFAFYGCSGLTSITIPDGVTSIGDSAFYGCNGLTTITIPDGVTSVESSAFYGCSGLTSITIPDGVTSIGSYAFRDCSRLTSITIPASVASIGSSAFYGCSSSVDIIGLSQCVCISEFSNVFRDAYQSVTNIVIADGVTRIAAGCFRNCYELRRIVIPASVSVIYDNAFQNCSALEEIIFLGHAPDVGRDILLGTPRSLKITVKEGTIGWNGGVSTDLPVAWPADDARARAIAYSRDAVTPEGGGSLGGGTSSGGGSEAVTTDARYDLSAVPKDRGIASMEVSADTSLDSFVLTDDKVFDAVLYVNNTADSAVKLSLPSGYTYKSFKGAKPLIIPPKSSNVLTITRVADKEFLVSRKELESVE